jgi:hypothetical protein
MNEYDSKNLIDKMKKSFLIAISSDIETFKYISRNAFHSLQKIKLNLPHPVIIWKLNFFGKISSTKNKFLERYAHIDGSLNWDLLHALAHSPTARILSLKKFI